MGNTCWTNSRSPARAERHASGWSPRSGGPGHQRMSGRRNTSPQSAQEKPGAPLVFRFYVPSFEGTRPMAVRALCVPCGEAFSTALTRKHRPTLQRSVRSSGAGIFNRMTLRRALTRYVGSRGCSCPPAQILSHLVLPVRPVVSSTRSPVVEMMGNPFACEDPGELVSGSAVFVRS